MAAAILLDQFLIDLGAMARKSCLAVFAALLVAHQVVTFVVGYAPTPRPRAGRVSGPGTAVRAFEGDAMAAMEVPMEIGQGVLGLGLLYAIMLLGGSFEAACSPSRLVSPCFL